LQLSIRKVFLRFGILIEDVTIACFKPYWSYWKIKVCFFIYSKEIVAAHLTILSMPAADLAPPIGSEIVYFMCSTHIEKLVKEV
jgi:hypothetical protein